MFCEPENMFWKGLWTRLYIWWERNELLNELIDFVLILYFSQPVFYSLEELRKCTIKQNNNNMEESLLCYIT